MDGILDPEEITETSYACNDAPGADGARMVQMVRTKEVNAAAIHLQVEEAVKRIL